MKNDLRRDRFTPGEICLLECLDYARDELRELMQRWDDRLTAQGLSLVKAYVKGRCSVALYLDIGTGSERAYVNYSATTDDESTARERYTADPRIDVSECGNGRYRYQQSVLIRNVETVKCVDGVIPSFVRLYGIDDQIDDVGPGDLYLSAIYGVHKFLPRISKRKVRPSIRGSSGERYDLASQEIESRTQIVDRVPDNERNFAWHGLGLLELDNVLARVEIFLNAETAEVRIQEIGEHPIKLVDMLIGPFDL